MKNWKALLIICVSLVIITLNFIICNAAEAGDKFAGVYTNINKTVVCSHLGAMRLDEITQSQDHVAFNKLLKKGACLFIDPGRKINLYTNIFNQEGYSRIYKATITGTNFDTYIVKVYLDDDWKKLK